MSFSFSARTRCSEMRSSSSRISCRESRIRSSSRRPSRSKCTTFGEAPSSGRVGTSPLGLAASEVCSGEPCGWCECPCEKDEPGGLGPRSPRSGRSRRSPPRPRPRPRPRRSRPNPRRGPRLSPPWGGAPPPLLASGELCSGAPCSGASPEPPPSPESAEGESLRAKRSSGAGIRSDGSGAGLGAKYSVLDCSLCSSSTESTLPHLGEQGQ